MVAAPQNPGQPTAALVEPGAPPWAQRMVLRLVERFWPVFPVQPLRLQAIDKANLPPAAAWPGAVVYIHDLKKIGLSNGTAWTDAMGGAV